MADRDVALQYAANRTLTFNNVSLSNGCVAKIEPTGYYRFFIIKDSITYDIEILNGNIVKAERATIGNNSETRIQILNYSLNKKCYIYLTDSVYSISAGLSISVEFFNNIEIAPTPAPLKPEKDDIKDLVITSNNVLVYKTSVYAASVSADSTLRAGKLEVANYITTKGFKIGSWNIDLTKNNSTEIITIS